MTEQTEKNLVRRRGKGFGAKIMGSVLVIIFQFLYNPKVDSRFALLP